MAVSISVIIPVYNGEQYIERSVESVLKQSAKDIEILMLDDGSTDDSLKLCREYEQNYPDMIKVFTHANMGVANTRNKGVSLAGGKYIMFLDQDDFFDIGYMETFLEAAEKNEADVVIGGYRRPDKEGKIRITVRPTDEEYIRYKNLQAWAKIHRADFLKENNILLFPNSIGEDIPFTLRENAMASRSVVIDYIGYNWYINEESVTHTVQTGLERNIEGIRNLLGEIHLTKTDNPLFEYVVIKTVIYLLLACGRVDTSAVFMKYYRELFEWLEANYPVFKKNKYILSGPKGQERSISIQVCLFLTMHRMRFVGLFAKLFCRGRQNTAESQKQR